MEQPTKEYLMGYKAGFYAALTIVWALAEELLIEVPNAAKSHVAAFINKIKA